MTEFVNSQPEFYDETTDVHRLNTLLDDITAKRFVAPILFVQAVRGALDLHGITLPHIDIEGKNGMTPEEGPAILAGVTNPLAPDMYAAPFDGEYIFHVEDAHGDISDIYLYMVCDKDFEGLFECYAQLVNEDELSEVMEIADDREYPEIPDETPAQVIARKTKGERGLDDGPPDV
jgi:hypothetical protein